MATPPRELKDPDDEQHHSHDDEPSMGMRNSKGWDGKMRVNKPALANPEALADSDYTDDENVLAGQVISADEDILDEEPSDTEEIIVTHSRVASIPALRLDRFKKVARICLRQNSIQVIEGLACLCATLEDLDLYDNLIRRIRGLEDLTCLTSLDLSFNKIRHIRNIDHLTGLRELFLVANKISHIEGLETLVNLKSLELGSNRIREIQGLDTLCCLEELWLAKNKITDISGLAALPKLRLLSIQANRISDLSPLAEAPTLEELYISDNALESVAGLEGNPRLRVLEISNNKIADLAGLAHLTELEELWASYNLIADFAAVEAALADKKNLATVYFEGNPLQTRGPALYRNKVRLALPQVKQIDATYVRV